MNVQEKLLQETIDPRLTDGVLGELAYRSIGERVATKGYRVLTGGCWNRVISIRTASGSERVEGSEEIVCKISPRQKDEQLAREYDVLSYFAENTDMPVPRPLLLDATAEFLPGTILVMTKIPGEVMHHCYGTLDSAGQRAVSHQIAGYVTELHRKRVPGFGGVELEADDRKKSWADFWLPRFDSAMEEIATGDYVPEAMIEEIADLRPGFPPALDMGSEVGSEGTLTHYDIWSGNVMIEFADGNPRVSGFIDIPGFFADYAREISFMSMFGCADEILYEVYREQHPLDPGFLLRVNMYNLKMHLRHVMMYPGEYYYLEGARKCLEYVRMNLP